MSARVTQALSERSVSKDDTTDAINRELLPALKQARTAINARFGDLSIVTADYQVTLLDEVLLCDASGGALTVTLLKADDATRELIIVKTDASAHTVTIAAKSGETINGSATQVLSAQWDFIGVQVYG